MKKIFTVSVALLLSLSIFAAKEQAEVKSLKGADAAKILSCASEVWITNDNNIPNFIEFRSDAQIDELNFFPILKKSFGLPAAYDMTLIRTEKDKLGWEHNRYQLTMNGIPVNEGLFILHMQNGKIIKYNGFIPKNVTASTSSSLSESAALTKALDNIPATTYRWQEADPKNGASNTSSNFYPKGQLCIVQGYNEIGTTASHLAWKFDIFATAPLSRDYIYVDAQTGTIIRKDNRIETANTNSTAATVYRGNRAIVADSYNGSYRLRETTRGNGISTFNMHTGTNYNAATDFTNATTTWTGTNTAKDQYARDAHWGAEMTMDFYRNKQGRNGIDGNGFALELYVHYDVNYLNAFWDGNEMNFGDGSSGYTPLTSLDITGHEISHGLTQYTANLNYQSESGAMNEAFSDIMGTAIEWYGDSTRANWTIGEDIGTPFRSMSAPKVYQQPNTYLGQYWYTGTQDDGGVHTNSGVENFWYYLLASGGTGTNDNNNAWSVTGIGRQKATAIAFRMETVYLVATSQYADARFYAIQAATDLFGACSQEVISTANAWYAVGVGAAYSASLASQFTNSYAISCSAPYTVNFTNTSTNTSTYTWYFGDGTTSNAVNPSHTYQNTGVYTVRLVSSGGCGTDSVTKTNLVNISTSNPCVVVMPTSGSAAVQTSCTGTIYDDGGAHAAYSSNVNSTVTISPIGATAVRLTFTAFRLENTYDFLYVYDGPTIGSPILGTYTGATIPASIISTQGSITVKFVSDQSVVDTGFAINWTCTQSNVAPTANFKSDVTTTCSGKVKFTDLTTGGPTSWLWNFGDGTTSTLQNPAKTYYANGTYTVSLTATNGFGSNTKTTTNLVIVSKPAAPAVVNGSRCGPGTVTLSATSTNTINWYDSANGSVVLSSANPFTTPSLTATKNYYAEESIAQPVYHVGPVDSTIGAGAYFNGNSSRALRFKVNKPSKLLSVFVYALTTGYRTIQYRDTNGVILASRSVYIQAGRGRVNLNIDLIPSTTTIYELGVADSMNLFRNTAGGVYPYNDAQGMVSIIGNNISAPAMPGYYYYFYDWMVEAPDCVSLRATATATIGGGLTDTKTSTPVACFGQATGAASVTPTSGIAPYTYHWNSGQTTPSLTNVVAGTYTVSVADNGGCSKVDTIVIAQPAAALVATSTGTNVACFGGTTGAISLTVTGGTTTYGYNWGGGITTPGRTNLAAGTYVVTVTDAHSCTTTRSTTITQPTAALAASSTFTAVPCFGGTTGAINLTVSGGTTTYGYNWGGGVVTQNRTNLAAGTYVVTVTDAHGCTTTNSTTVTQPTAALLAQGSTSNVSCFGAANGAITLNVSGGTTTYNYNWGGNITTPGRTNLAPGTYTVTVTDAHGCTAIKTSTVTQPNAISIQVSSIQASCGQNNGSATATATGGTGTLGYRWAGGQTTPAISSLGSGNYSVVVTDVNGCTATQGVNVTSPASFSLSNAITSLTCHGAGNGAATITPSITPGTYTYAWPGGLNGATQSNLAGGTYLVNVTDGNSCSKIDTIIIREPAAITDVLSATAALCHGAATGAISVQASGGTGAFSYQWSPSVSNLTTVSAGTYAVTITDANHCAKTDVVTVTEPSAITAQNQITNILCHGAATGAATVTATGGTGAYTYQWNASGANNGLSNVVAGTYIVTVADANSCAISDTIRITEPTAVIQATASSTIAHNGGTDGTATVSAHGGTGTLTYAWGTTPIQTTATATNLAAGTYTVTITDANGCTTTAQTIVDVNTAITEVSDIIKANIYPNPANTNLTISIDLEKSSDVSIEIRDMLGRIVTATKFANEKELRSSVDVSSWAAAVYTVQIRTDDNIIVKEITIQH